MGAGIVEQVSLDYKLDNGGIEVAQQGIDNLRVSAPFVLSMLKDIEEIVLEDTSTADIK